MVHYIIHVIITDILRYRTFVIGFATWRFPLIFHVFYLELAPSPIRVTGTVDIYHSPAT